MGYVTGTPQNPTDSARQGLAAAIAQAVTAQAASHGLPFVPASMADAIVAQATNDLNARPSGQLRGLSLADGTLMSVVAASFSAALSQLSEPQQRALRMGLDPFNAAVVSGLVLAAAAGRGGRGHAEDDQAETRSSRRFASLRDRDDECSEKARQFAGLGFGGATMENLSGLEIERKFVERLLLLGYTKMHIANVARDAMALGLRGTHAVGVATAAPTDLRSAAAAIATARSAQEREEAERRYRELVEEYSRLPDSDPRKQQAKDFVDIIRAASDMRHQMGAEAAGSLSTAQQMETITRAPSGQQQAMEIKRKVDAEVAGKSQAARAAEADDFFGASTPTAQSPSRSRGPTAS